MPTFTLTKSAIKFDRLMRELLVAVPTLTRLEAGEQVARFMLTDRPTQIDLIVPEDTAAAVQATIAAHNPNAPDAVEQQATDDAASLSDLAQQYGNMLSALTGIQNRMATIQATNIGNVAAASTAIKQLASDLDLIATGLRRVLKALRVELRRTQNL